MFFTVIVFSGFEGSAGSAINTLRIDYGSSGLGGSTASDGGYSFSCRMNNKITRVKGTTVPDKGGFVIMLEFIGEDGTSCSIGQLTNHTKTLELSYFDVSHPGYHLSYLSGGISYWWNLKTDRVVNGIKFHWKKED